MAATRLLALDAWRPYDHGCHINPPTTRETCLSWKWRFVNKPEKKCCWQTTQGQSCAPGTDADSAAGTVSRRAAELVHIRSGTSAVAVGPRYSAYPASSHSSVVCGTATEQQPGGRHAATIIACPDQSKEPNRVCRTLSDNAYKVRQQQGPSTLERHVASWCHAESPCDKA